MQVAARASAQDVTDPAARGDGEWQRQAQCRVEYAMYFFAAEGELRKDREAREEVARGICGSCLVQQPCLDVALSLREPHGIWGGLNERQRRGLHRRRGDAGV